MRVISTNWVVITDPGYAWYTRPRGRRISISGNGKVLQRVYYIRPRTFETHMLYGVWRIKWTSISSIIRHVQRRHKPFQFWQHANLTHGTNVWIVWKWDCGLWKRLWLFKGFSTSLEVLLKDEVDGNEKVTPKHKYSECFQIFAASCQEPLPLEAHSESQVMCISQALFQSHSIIFGFSWERSFSSW